MLNSLFTGIFDSASTTVIPVGQFLLCVAVSLLIGGLVAFSASRRARFTHSFLAALAALPALVCVTIMMVNGNIGAGVATAGAFSLVRFRSAQGTAREIVLIFMSMVAGIIAGMGYLAYAVLFALIFSGLFLLAGQLDPDLQGLRKSLRITVPENLDYEGMFDELLAAFCSQWKLDQVKTTNMGSLFKLRYELTLKKGVSEKELIDKLRCHNGNLEISLSPAETVSGDL